MILTHIGAYGIICVTETLVDRKELIEMIGEKIEKLGKAIQEGERKFSVFWNAKYIKPAAMGIASIALLWANYEYAFVMLWGSTWPFIFGMVLAYAMYVAVGEFSASLTKDSFGSYLFINVALAVTLIPLLDVLTMFAAMDFSYAAMKGLTFEDYVILLLPDFCKLYGIPALLSIVRGWFAIRKRKAKFDE